jgi:hypothetical protein
MQTYVQIVQDGSRSANLIAAYPPQHRRTRENPHGVLYRLPACVTSSSVVRDMVVSAPMGRDGICTGPQADVRNRQAASSAAPARDLHDVADREDKSAPTTHSAAPAVQVLVTESVVGVSTTRQVPVTGSFQAVVSSFVASTDAVVRPGIIGTTLGVGVADPHAHCEADGLARLGVALYRSAYEQSFSALMTAVMASAAAPSAEEKHSMFNAHSDARMSHAPAFIRDWAFPLSPLFVPHTDRVPRRMGAVDVIKQIGRVAHPPALKGIASAADLLSLLDLDLAACLRKQLTKQPLCVSVETASTRHGASPVKLASNRPNRAAMEDVNAATFAKHTAFTALFSPAGLCRVHGAAFFDNLSHSERMVVASFALCLDAFDELSSLAEEPADRTPPTWSPQAGHDALTPRRDDSGSASPGRYRLFKEMPWSYSDDRGDPAATRRELCTLQGFNLGGGYVYVACLCTPKNGPVHSGHVGHGFVLRLLRTAASDTSALSRHLTMATVDAVGASGFRCCGGDRALAFYDLSEIDHAEPGLMAAHLARLDEAHSPQICIGGQFLGRKPWDKVPKGLGMDDAGSMIRGLDALRVTAHACPPLAVAASRSLSGAVSSTLIAADRSGKPKVETATLDTADNQEWQLRPDAECAFVVSMNALGGCGSQLHTSAAEASRLVPACVKVAYRTRADCSNRHDVPSSCVASTSDDGNVTASHVFDAPTPIYVDNWPDSTDDEGVQLVKALNERAINSASKGHQACAQSPLGWGLTSIRATVTLADEASASEAARCARLWAKHMAVLDASLLRSAVNLAYRQRMKIERKDADDDDSTASAASNPDFEEYTSDAAWSA